MRLLDVDTWELVGFQNELIRHFMLAADVVGVVSGSLCMTRTDQHSWKGSWWDWVWMVPVDQSYNCTSRLVPIHVFREHLACFFNVKIIMFHKLKFIHQIGGFTVSKRGEGIRIGGFRTSESFGGDVVGACFIGSVVVKRGSF